MTLIIITVVSAVLSWALCFPVRRVLMRWDIIDRPNERSSHVRPIARGGGIAILASILLMQASVGLGGSGWMLLMAAMLIAIVSFVDDIRSLPSSLRFGCHLIAAVAALGALGWLGLASSGNEGFWVRALGIGLAFIWLVGYTNAFNFMDGINGLAAGQAVLTGLGSVIVLGFATLNWGTPPMLMTLMLVGAAAGFLPHNAVRPLLFMGDVGSAPLGFLLAGLALWQVSDSGWWLLPPILLLHANFVLDTSITLLRRMIRGEPWLKPHREHFYQRLVRAGSSHLRVTLIEMGLQVVSICLALAYLYSGLALRLGLVVATILLWLCFFAWVESRFQRANR